MCLTALSEIKVVEEPFVIFKLFKFDNKSKVYSPRYSLQKCHSVDATFRSNYIDVEWRTYDEIVRWYKCNMPKGGISGFVHCNNITKHKQLESFTFLVPVGARYIIATPRYGYIDAGKVVAVVSDIESIPQFDIMPRYTLLKEELDPYELMQTFSMMQIKQERN